MTIAAGFKCPEGLVLCADSQETVGEFLKRSEPKLIIHGTGRLEYGDEDGNVNETRAIFAGAGDGPFIDMTVDRLCRRMKNCSLIYSEVIQAIEDELISIHQRYWPLYIDAERPRLEMLIGLYTPEEPPCPTPILLKVSGPIVTEVQTYDCVGWGLSLGKYIGDRMHKEQMETSQAALLGIYLLEQAKNAVPYCGGESHLAIMHLTGWINRLTQEYVNKAVAAFSNFEKVSNRLLLKVLEFKFNESEMMKSFADFYDGWPELKMELDALNATFSEFMRSTSKTSKQKQ